MFAPLPYQRDVPLRTLTTLGIGGPARYLVQVQTVEDLQYVLRICAAQDLPFFLLGKGSNVLFDDRGFDGVVVLNKIDFMEKPLPGVFRVGSGYSFALLGVQTARNGWCGLEFASGIPATVGGAVFMNAGANGMETAQFLQSVEFVEPSGMLKILQKEDLQFGYRTSTFQEMKGGIAAVTFSLAQDPEARQRQLQIIKYRTDTQPYHEKSAGCIFRNPACHHAGALIEKCGLKGASIGDAAVSTKHANFLINRGQATTRDFLHLISHVQEIVREQTGLKLEPEVRLIPYQAEEESYVSR